MVIALIDGEETTLKKFYRQGEKVRLQPANVSMEPIMVEGHRVRIQGIVTGVLRKYV
jgi:repressor LexA